MSNRQKSMLSGITILTVSGLLCKIVGALYRIPLSHLIGEDGIATYQLVFPTYNILLTVSAAGFPVAVSRMVSYFIAKEDPHSAKRTLRLALYLLTVFGLISMLLMVLFSPALAARTGDITTQPGFVAIAPALFLVCVMSALRGFLQGQQDMVPTAVSQLIEQVGKVFICLPMAYFGMRISVAYAAAGMLLGTSIAEGVALLYIYCAYRKNKSTFSTIPQCKQSTESDRSLMKQLISLTVPITIGSCVIPFSAFIDSGMILNRMQQAGIAYETAKPLYGCYSGYVLTLINVPTAIATSIAMSIVPSISAAMAKNDREKLSTQSALGLRLSMILALPCSVGMSLLSRQILSLVYRFDDIQRLNTTAEIMSLSSLTIILFTLVQATTGILQGMKKERIPVITLFAGVLVKIFLNYVLIGTPGIGLYGAPIASLFCYGISLIPNLICVYKAAHIRLNWMDGLLKPVFCAAVMGAVLLAAVHVLPDRKIWTPLMVLLGMAVYLGVALLTKTVTKQDLAPILRRFGKKTNHQEG